MSAALSFDSAYRQVKRGQLAPVYYLTGDEDILKDELVHLIVDQAVDPAGRDFNVDVRSAADLGGEALNALVDTPPLLAERRAVVVRGIEQWRKNAKVWQVLHRYVERPADATVLVLLQAAGEKPHQDLARSAVHVVVEGLPPARIAKWVERRADRAGVALTPDAVEHLMRAVGTDLAPLSMEIEKLAAASGDGVPLSAGDVAPLLGVRHGETPHDWVAAAMARDVARASAMTDAVLGSAGVTAVRLLMSLGTVLVGVRLAAALLADGATPGRVAGQVLGHIKAARPSGLGSWRQEADRWTEYARHWSITELDAALRAAYEADRALKSTTVTDDAGILISMLLYFTPNAAGAA